MKCSIDDDTCSAGSKLRRGWCQRHYRAWKAHGDPHGAKVYARRGEALVFALRATSARQEECIVWPFGRNNQGYGRLYVRGEMWHAHRFVLSLTAGPPPAQTYQAAHAPEVCHNRACINPRHLRWATPSENAADKAIDGTLLKGERHGMAKLTAADVIAIRKDPRPLSAVGADYGISKSQTGAIRQRKRWASLDDAETDS